MISQEYHKVRYPNLRCKPRQVWLNAQFIVRSGEEQRRLYSILILERP